MKRTWKSLAATAVAAALVLAPLATAGAVADDTPPPDAVVEPAVVEAVEPAAEAPAEVVEPVAEPVAEVAPVEAPAVVETVEPAAPPAPAQPESQGRTAVPTPTYVLALWKAEPGTEWPQTLVASTDTTSTSLDALDEYATEDCTFYQVDLYADNETTRSLIAGGVLNGPSDPPESFPDIYGPKWKQWTTTCPPPPNEPPTVTITPDCAAGDDGNVRVVATNPNDVTVPVTLYLDFNGDGIPDASEILQVVPGVTNLWYTFTEDVTVGIAVYFEGAPIFAAPVTVNCQPDVYPVPAQFSADPDPASCSTPGAFSTTFLGEPVSDDGEGTTEYVFENVDVSVTRTDDGVFLTIQAHEGYVLAGLDEEKWDVSGDGLFAERFITLDPVATVDPQTGLPCLQVVLPVPAAPTFADACGTANDTYTVPEGTDQFFYSFSEAPDSDAAEPGTFPGTGTVTIFVIPLSEVDVFPEGTVTEWSFTFTDVACATTPPVVTPPPTTVTPPKTVGTPTGSLAVTGGGDVSPILPIGASLLVLAGLALTVGRKLIRR